jgi:hypothetical protein
MILPLLSLGGEEVAYLAARKIPQAIAALWVVALFRALAGDVFGGLNDLLTAFCGTAVMRTAPPLTRLVRCLDRCFDRVFAQNAVQWFFPFLLLTTLNAFFDIVQLVSLALQIGAPLVTTVVFWIWTASVILKLYMAQITWQVLQQMASTFETSAYNPLPDGPENEATGRNPAPGGEIRFVPFTGVGHRIDSDEDPVLEPIPA